MYIGPFAWVVVKPADRIINVILMERSDCRTCASWIRADQKTPSQSSPLS